MHGAIASSGDGSTEMDLIKNWFSELSALPKTPLQLQNQIDGRSIDDIDSTDRSCYYCRSTEFVSGQDSVGGECFIPEPLMTTSKKIGLFFLVSAFIKFTRGNGIWLLYHVWIPQEIGRQGHLSNKCLQ